MTPVQTVELIFQAFRRGDIPSILGLVAAGAYWRQEKTVPWGGIYTGPEGVGEFFTKLDAAVETVGFDVRENIGCGDEVFSFGSYTLKGRTSGKVSAPAEWMFRWKISDGKVVFWQSYFDSAALVAALS